MGLRVPCGDQGSERHRRTRERNVRAGANNQRSCGRTICGSIRGRYCTHEYYLFNLLFSRKHGPRTLASQMAITDRPSPFAKITPGLADQLERLDQQAASNGWQLTTPAGHLDWSDGSLATNEILGPHLLVIPRQLATLRRVGIVSSRIGRSFDQWPDWFSALRAAVVGTAEQRDVLVTSPNTATAVFVERAARLYGRRVIDFGVAAKQGVHRRLVPTRPGPVASPPKSQQSKILVSPAIVRPGDAAAAIPLRDRALFGICNQIIALHVRASGFTLRLLQERLRQRPSLHRQTQMALGRGLVAAKIRDALLDQGAIGRAFLEHEEAASAVPGKLENEWTIESVASSDGQWPYLTHCTRRRYGPWPDQTQREFLDDLILRREAAQHSALDSLRYILQKNRLVASAESVQGTQEVVCFTAVPLAELRRLRVFRPHRGRWDFEPYGICIRQAYLAQRGAFPVKYVTDATEAEHEGARLQRAASNTKSGNTLDWTVEQEWRHVGDLALDLIPHDAAFVFVRSAEEALVIQRMSRWPVVVLPEGVLESSDEAILT